MQKSPQITIDTNITIKCNDEKEVKTIYSSLQPDNRDFPSNLILDMQTKGSCLLMNLRFIKNKEKQDNISTLLNTIDELLEHVTIIKQVIKDD